MQIDEPPPSWRVNPARGLPEEEVAPVAAELTAFTEVLRRSGLPEALRFLSARTSHRFTGVFRFDGDMLISVALVDKWLPEVERGGDVPLAQAYCAHLKATGEPIAIVDGRIDPRTRWMAQSGVISYCGAVIRDQSGEPWGALCHFDPDPCEPKRSAIPLLAAAAALIHDVAAGS